MKKAKRIILIAAAAIAVLTVQGTAFAKASVVTAQGFNGTQPASTCPHMDGTEPMPPYPG
jgi:hypothetical protein